MGSELVPQPLACRLMRLHFIALFVALALLAGACGGGDGDTDSTEPDDAIADLEDTAATSTSSGVAPSTTILVSPPIARGPAPLVEVDPLGAVGGVRILSDEPVYTGVFGQIDASRNVVAPVALPPATQAPGVAPLTGLPMTPADAERPAIIVKLDNTKKGRPQEALSQADLVYVLMVENGVTRLAAVFHSVEPEILGPVRSGRTSDIALFSSLNNPIFAFSGANRVHHAVIRQFEMIDLGAGTRSEYHRAPDRPGTYDLMTLPTDLWSIAASREAGGAPPPHFEYRDESIGLPPSARPARSITIDYPSATSVWEFDAEAAGWVRTQDGEPHVDADGERVMAANVLVAEVDHVRTGSSDVVGTAVYEEQFLGSGRGWVVTDGHVIEVTWNKPSLDSVATWTTADGIPVALLPGRTWVEIAPVGSVTVG